MRFKFLVYMKVYNYCCYVILVYKRLHSFSDFSHEVREIISRLWQFKSEIIASFWPYLVVMAAFITFVFWNGSIVLGTNSHFCSFVSLWCLFHLLTVHAHAFFAHPWAFQVQKRLTRFLHILHNWCILAWFLCCLWLPCTSQLVRLQLWPDPSGRKISWSVSFSCARH